jgi:hypothetical protein
MSYQPPRVKTSYERVRGLAKVQLNKDGRAKVNFKDGPTFVVPASGVDADPVWAGIGFCEVSENGQHFFSMRPNKGLFDGICIGVATDNDSKPIVQVKDGRYGPYEVFYALIQINEGKYKGATYTNQLIFRFVEADGVAALPNERGKSRATDELEDWMFSVGAWQKPLPWKDDKTILMKIINKRILNAARQFKFSVKDGYVDQLIDVELDTEEVGWDE